MRTQTTQALSPSSQWLSSQWLTYKFFICGIINKYDKAIQTDFPRELQPVGLYSTDRMSRPNPTNLITYTNTPVPNEISYF